MSTLCLVNLAQLDPPTNGGTSRIAYEVSKTLIDWSRSAPDRRAVFSVNWRFAAQFGNWLGEDVLIIPYFSRLDARKITSTAAPDFIVSPLFGMTPFGSPSYAHIRHIAQMPDALVFDKPTQFTPRQFKRRTAIYRQLANASSIVTLSNHARERLQEHLDIPAERFHVIPLGADALDTPALPEARFTLPKRYVFYPANVWPHKRHALLFKAMARIVAQQPDVQLVLAGGRDAAAFAHEHGAVCGEDVSKRRGWAAD